MISYTVATNLITVTGYSEVTPCNFTDLYNADKAGTLSLHARTGITVADGAAIAVDRAERPADYIVLGGASNDLYITVANWNGTTATIRITGTDRDGTAQTEDIVVNANGQYNTTKWFKTITHTQVTVFTATSFDYDLTQGQWGVVSRQCTNQICFDCGLYVGDGTTNTWFGDKLQFVKFLVAPINTAVGVYASIYVVGNAHFKLGTITDAAEKTSKQGCVISFETGVGRKATIAGTANANVELYSSYLDSPIISYLWCRHGTSGHLFRMYNTTISGMDTLSINSFTADMFNNLHICNGLTNSIGLRALGTIDKVTILDTYLGVLGSDGNWGVITKNIYARNNNYIFRASGISVDCYLINVDSDQWNMRWDGTSTANVYRQYTFNLKVLDTNQNNVENATVILKDKDGTQIFSLTTNASGEITEQTVSYGYYNQANGNTLQSYSPHTLEIRKAGYKTYKKKFTMDSKIDWTIALQKVLDNNFSKRVNFNNY